MDVSSLCTSCQQLFLHNRKTRSTADSSSQISSLLVLFILWFFCCPAMVSSTLWNTNNFQQTVYDTGGLYGGGSSSKQLSIIRDDNIHQGRPRGIKWWVLHRSATSSLGPHNAHTVRPLFTEKQWRLFTPKRCERFDFELLKAALRGMQIGIRECERQMRHNRWNCSKMVRNNRYGSIFGRLLWKGIPEAAFVYSVVSAGITTTVAAECRRKLTCCPCTERRRYNPRNQFIWAQCDHNIQFARNFAKRLLDRVERGTDLRYMTILHNYNTGRRVVMKTMGLKCLCHGTSGTCVTKTCWKQVATMENIGSELRKKFNRSKKVIQGNSNKPFVSVWVNGGSAYDRSRHTIRNTQELIRNRRRGRRRRRRRLNLLLSTSPHSRPRRPSRSSLVHFESLPRNFFCERNAYWGVIGTQGRKCNSTSTGADNCSHLCCGRGFNTKRYTSTEPCRCRFVWCCKVVCDSCKFQRTKETCK